MAAEERDLREDLLDRRRQLEVARETVGPSEDIARLVEEVDAALGRMAAGTFGLCETCHGSIEADRLQADPLLRYCIDHLSASEQRALQQDLDLASRIQGSLLPQQGLRSRGWEFHHRYEPLGPVSGDICDLVSSGDGGSLFVLVGDVSGKGVAASIRMAQLHATFRSLIDVGLPLGELVQRANRVFCESIMSSHFATLVCARAGADGELELSNAGHPPPLLVRRGDVTRIAASGLPMGVFCRASFGFHKVRLEPGDTLVLYTDGLTEARDRHDAEYGLERLARLVASRHAGMPDALADACLADLAAFRGGSPRTDDLTLMVIRRTG